MAAEYLYNEEQTVALNGPVLFDPSIPCKKGNVIYDSGSGGFVLRGNTNQCYATYQCTFNGNIAVPDGGTAVPIAIAIAINGEPRLTSKAVFTPAAAGDYGNVTSTCIVRVPRGCCFTLAVEAVPADPAETPTPSINVQNSNLVISRIS